VDWVFTVSSGNCEIKNIPEDPVNPVKKLICLDRINMITMILSFTVSSGNCET